MDNPELWLTAFGASVFMAVLFFLVCLEAGKMSGGKLKFLEDVNRKLYERLDEIFPLREEWLYAARCAIMLFAICSAICLGLWSTSVGGLNSENWYRLAMKPTILVVCICAVLELMGTILTITASARVLLIFIPIFKTLSIILFPWTFSMGALSRKIARRRISTLDEGGEVPTVEDEILSLVEGETTAEQSKAAVPDLEDDEKRMIVGALELDEVTVRRIMTPRVEVVGVEYEEGENVSDFVRDARNAIVSSGHSRIPVYSGTIDNVIGVVYSKDLLDDAKLTDISKVFHRNPLFIPISKNIGDLLEEFRQNKIHLAIVVDEYGGTAGIVTFEDVLETLVGDIKDEYDSAEGSLELEEIRDGVYVCDARTPVALANKIMDVEIPEDKEYDTIGGYLSACTGRIPVPGEVVDTGILLITVRKADSRRVIEVELTAKTEE